MHITIDINVKGLEGLITLLKQASGSEQVSGNVVPMPTPTAAPVITTATAPQLAVVPNAPAPAAPVAAPAYPTAAPAPAQMSAAVPIAAAQTYTEQQLAVAATQLMDAGRQPELIALLASYGVQALTQLPKEQYGNFATQLRAMGAKI